MKNPLDGQQTPKQNLSSTAKLTSLLVMVLKLVVLCLILKAIATFLCNVGGGSNISRSFVDTTYKVEYKEKIKIINKEKIKIEKRYDTLFMYFLDSPYSTKLLDSTITIHRFIDSQECKLLSN
jgi:hypothetical protein